MQNTCFCGTGTRLIDALGRCWCGQQWDSEQMSRPSPSITSTENLGYFDGAPKANDAESTFS